MEERPPITTLTTEALRRELQELERQIEERTTALSRANNELTQEIAARQRAEAAERAQREYFQVTLASIGDAVIVTDAHGVITFVNPVAQALTGWGQEEATGRPLPEVFDIVNEETQNVVENPVSRVLREGRVVGLANHTLLRTKSGAAIPIDDSAAPIRDATGQLRGIVLVFRDISERRQAEQALRQSEARYRIVSDLVADYAYAVRIDPNGRGILEWVTEAFSRITGFTVQELEAGDGLEWLIHSEDMPRVRHRLNALFSGQPGFSEHRIVTKSGEVRWLRDYSCPEFDPVQGRLVRIIGAGQDITERKQAETALAQRTAELERSNEALQQFAYIVSHDLQEPLRTVMSFMQLLAKRYQGRLDPEADEFMNYVLEGSARMQTLIRDLLAYARVDSRGVRRVLTNCQVLWQQVLHDLRVASEEHGATVTSDPLPTILVDEQQLGLVLQNLLSNALKFHGTEPPRIHLSVRQEGNDWLFALRDNGIGIAPEHAERIFAVFHRIHGQDQYPGTGVGLAICKKIVENHGGRIWVESTLGQGATFFFTVAEGSPRRTPDST